MRSILDTRPKGAPGRDKPVPYGAVLKGLQASDATTILVFGTHLPSGATALAIRPIRHRRGVREQTADASTATGPRPTEPDAQDRFEAMVPYYHARVLEALDSQTASTLDEADLGNLISSILRRIETTPDAPTIAGAHDALATRLVDEMRGLGPLGPLLRDPDVSDIMVNGLESVYVERGGRLSQGGRAGSGTWTT